MSETSLGKIVPLYKGPYNAGTEYKINDVVYYDYGAYWHKKAESTTGVAPTDTTTWGPIAVGIKSMTVNSDGSFHLVYSDGRTVNIGADVISEITGYLEDAEDAADRAEAAALSVEYPVSYAQQTGKTEAQKTQARTNIGAASKEALDELEAKVNKYDDLSEIVKITAQNTTLGQINTMLNEINTAGDHVFFDVSSLGANAYLCTFFCDGEKFKVTDLVKLRTYTVEYNASTLLATILAEAYDIATHAEIENLQKEINRIAGGDVGDEIVVNKVATLSITSSSGHLTFTVTDEHKFAIAVGECGSKEYLLVWDGTAWRYNDTVVSDFGITVTGTPVLGEVMIVKMTATESPFTIVHHHTGELGENETHPVTSSDDFYIVEETYTPDSNVFDNPESALCITPGHTLQAGKYFIRNIAGATSDYWCNYKRLYYCFEIPHDIVATEETGDIYTPFYQRGDRETTGDARGVYILRVKPTYANTGELYNSDVIEFVGQLTAPSEEYTDLRTLEDFTVDQTMDSEGIIYNNLGHVCYGNNNFDVSNMFQRLNSAEKSMNPVRLHKNDVVTSLKNVKGFQWGLDPRFLNAVANAEYSMQYGLGDEFTSGTLHTAQSKCFLLSMKEMSFNIQTNEGVVTDLYDIYCGGALKNDAIAARAKSNSKGTAPANYRWSRASYASLSLYCRGVAPSGAYDYNLLTTSYRLARAYIIPKSAIGNLGSKASE